MHVSPRFTQATSLTRTDEGAMRWDVPDGWQQGRGAWGGLVAGAIASSVLLSESDEERALRTLSIHLAAPVMVGPATVRVAALRLGSSMSTWQAIVVDQAGQTCAHAVAITGRSRAPDLAEQSLTWDGAGAPTLPPVSEAVRMPQQAPGLPVFLRHLDLRVVDGLPGTGSATRCTGYVRFDDQGAWDAASLLAVVDAWWPTVLPALSGFRPLATVTYAAHLLVDPATVPPGEPLAYEASMASAHEGFTTETRRLWTPDGRLAVENHQSIVVIR